MNMSEGAILDEFNKSINLAIKQIYQNHSYPYYYFLPLFLERLFVVVLVESAKASACSKYLSISEECLLLSSDQIAAFL